MNGNYETGMSAADIAARHLGHEDEETLRLRALENTDEDKDDNGDTDNDGKCMFCGQVHGATMFAAQRMPRVSDGDRATQIEDALKAAFGDMFNSVSVVDADTAPVLSREDIVILNAMLLTQAGTMLYQATRNPELLSQALINQAQVMALSGSHVMERVERFQSIGTRLLDVLAAMTAGKTSGLFVAPF